MNKFVLFYSEKCKYSQEFLRLIQPTDLNELFIKISIHDKSIKLPPKLTSVPTIIVPNIPKPLTGKDVFEWLNYFMSQHERQDSVQERLNKQHNQNNYQQKEDERQISRWMKTAGQKSRFRISFTHERN